MTRVSLISSSPELRERLQPLTGDSAFTPAGSLGNPRTMIESFTGAPPEVLIMDCRADADGKLALAEVLTEAHPAIGVLLVSDRPGDLALAAMRAGVHDIVSPQATLPEFGAAVESAAQATRTRMAHRLDVSTEPVIAEPTGRVVSVVSPKGGVGKTTVATNVAVGLARSAPGSTVIVDLDIQFGDVASALDLEPEHFLADVVHGSARYDSMVLKTFLTPHRSGLYAICAPNSPGEADMISAQDVTHLVRMLAAEFRYVVLDTAPGLSETTLTALDQTTDLIMLTSMDVPGVRGLRKELDTLGQLGLLVDSRQVVLNFAEPRGLLSVLDVEATIGAKVDLVLPRSKATLNSVNQGAPLLQTGGRDPMTKQLRRLVDRITRSGSAAATKNGMALNQAASQTDPRPTPSRWRRNRQVFAA